MKLRPCFKKRNPRALQQLQILLRQAKKSSLLLSLTPSTSNRTRIRKGRTNKRVGEFQMKVRQQDILQTLTDRINISASVLRTRNTLLWPCRDIGTTNPIVAILFSPHRTTLCSTALCFPRGTDTGTIPPLSLAIVILLFKR